MSAVGASSSSVVVYKREENLPKELSLFVPFSFRMQHFLFERLGTVQISGAIPMERAFRSMDRMMDLVSTTVEDKEELALIEQNAMDTVFQLVRAKWAEAGISSIQEFTDRRDEIAALKLEATKICIQDPANLRLAIDADLAVVQAVKGRLSPKNQSIVENFWNAVATDISILEQYEKEFTAHLSEIIVGINELVAAFSESLVKTKGKVDTYALVLTLQEKIGDLVSEEFQKVQREKKPQVLLQYLMLQGELKVPSILNLVQRPMLQTIAQDDINVKLLIPKFSLLESFIMSDLGFDSSMDLTSLIVPPEMRLSPEERTLEYLILKKREEFQKRLDRFTLVRPDELEEVQAAPVAKPAGPSFLKELLIGTLCGLVALLIYKILIEDA